MIGGIVVVWDKLSYAPARLTGSRDAHSHVMARGVLFAFAVSSWKQLKPKRVLEKVGLKVECSYCSEVIIWARVMLTL